ncbi:MAG: SseB family protein [Eubacteriales bacterium]|nr:SseB family protein [Eubacteriales bacterium]
MTNTKQEELKKLLASGDFKADNYERLSMQEVIILKNSAKAMKEKNIRTPQAAQFFAKREEFFNRLVLQRLQKLETIYVLLTKATNLPYVYCDPDTCNDQVWMFSEESFARKAAMLEMQKKRELIVGKMENKQFLSFYMSLYAMGVNELLIDRGVNTLAVELETLVKKPDYSNMPKEKRPVMNPELLLTAVYFAQERNMPEDVRDTEQMKEFEEEMMVNLQRGTLMMPVMVPEGQEKITAKDMKLPYLKLSNGDMYQPVCTDPSEFQRFNREKKFRAITVDCGKLRTLLPKEAKGILLNPATVRLVIPREKF